MKSFIILFVWCIQCCVGAEAARMHGDGVLSPEGVSHHGYTRGSAVSLDGEGAMERQSSGVSEKVQPLLEGFDPEKDVIFYDWDQTIAGEEAARGSDVREVRSPASLRLFKDLRAAHPGRVFIYSNGNAFVFDKTPDGEPVLDQALPYLPDFFKGKKLLGTANLQYYTDDGANIGMFNRTSQYAYLPTFHAFYTPKTRANNLVAETIPAGHLKGYHLPTILKVLGFSSAKPIRNVYFIDNDANVIEGMRQAVEKLQVAGVVKNPLQAVHVPFYDAVR